MYRVIFCTRNYQIFLLDFLSIGNIMYCVIFGTRNYQIFLLDFLNVGNIMYCVMFFVLGIIKYSC